MKGPVIFIRSVVMIFQLREMQFLAIFERKLENLNTTYVGLVLELDRFRYVNGRRNQMRRISGQKDSLRNQERRFYSRDDI